MASPPLPWAGSSTRAGPRLHLPALSSSPLPSATPFSPWPAAAGSHQQPWRPCPLFFQGAQQMHPWPSSLGARWRPALLHGQVPWCGRPFPLVAALAACVGLPAGAPPMAADALLSSMAGAQQLDSSTLLPMAPPFLPWKTSSRPPPSSAPPSAPKWRPEFPVVFQGRHSLFLHFCFPTAAAGNHG
jgi:hypothetical protein